MLVIYSYFCATCSSRVCVTNTCCVSASESCRLKHGFPHPVRRLRRGGSHLYSPSLQILGPAADPVYYPSQLCGKGKK